MEDLVDRLKRDLQNEEVRYVYADTVTNAFVSAQIKGLREDRGLSQEQLASLIGTQQSGISRIEKAEYSAWRVETLRKLAKALGVRLRIRFEGFGTLIDEIKGFDDRNLVPARFENDPVFNEQRSASRRRSRSAWKVRFSKQGTRAGARKRKQAKNPFNRKPVEVAQRLMETSSGNNNYGGVSSFFNNQSDKQQMVSYGN